MIIMDLLWRRRRRCPDFALRRRASGALCDGRLRAGAKRRIPRSKRRKRNARAPDFSSYWVGCTLTLAQIHRISALANHTHRKKGYVLNHPIVRLYDNAAKSADAIAKLKKEGLPADLITLVAPSGQSKDAIVAAIAAGYVLKSEAVVYAEAVARGESLVIVRAPFGKGGAVTKLLDRFGPSPSPVTAVPDYALLWDEAAPISSALRIPTLSSGLFSTFWTLPVLTRWDVRLPIPALSEASPKAKLSSNPTPLSSLFKLPLLI